MWCGEGNQKEHIANTWSDNFIKMFFMPSAPLNCVVTLWMNKNEHCTFCCPSLTSAKFSQPPVTINWTAIGLFGAKFFDLIEFFFKILKFLDAKMFSIIHWFSCYLCWISGGLRLMSLTLDSSLIWKWVILVLNDPESTVGWNCVWKWFTVRKGGLIWQKGY